MEISTTIISIPEAHESQNSKENINLFSLSGVEFFHGGFDAVQELRLMARSHDVLSPVKEEWEKYIMKEKQEQEEWRRKMREGESEKASKIKVVCCYLLL